MLHPAYIAGLFDGEGTASLVYSVKRYRKDGKTPMSGFLFRLFVSNTNTAVIDKLTEQFGGRVNAKARVRNPAHKTVLSWNLGGAAAQRDFLRMMLPHLIIKKKAAKVGLRYLKTVGPVGSRVSEAHWATRIECFLALREINRRGTKIATASYPSTPPDNRISKRLTPDELAAFMRHVRGEC